MALDKNGLERLWMHIVARLGEKVNIEEGKGLSSNDYTHLEKEKLASIENGAQVNVQSDWRNMNEDNAAFILNKPVSYEQISIDWDGNTEGHVLAFAEGATAPFACKVSDIYCNPTQLIGGTVTVQGTEESNADITETFTISLDNVSGMPDSEGNFGGVYYNEGSQFISVEKPCTLNFFYFDLILPESGTYFTCHESSYYISNLTFYNETLNPVILPVATSETLGAVKPIVKTEDMTQGVGVDENGALWTTKLTSPYSLNLEWDGNTEGHTVVTPTETASTYGLITSESLFVKMSDECPASSHLIGAVIDVYYNNNGEVTSGDTVITNDNIDYISSYNTTAYSIFDGWIMIIPKPTTIRFEQGKVLSFEESGIYFRYMTLSTGDFGYTTKLEINSEKLNSSLLVKEPLIIDIMSGTNTYEAAYTYDGSEPLTIALGMPVATETAFGVVKPVTKTDAMIQSVGIDENGALWTEFPSIRNELILNSSTEGSTKKFKLTIDDNGVLTATEMVE